MTEAIPVTVVSLSPFSPFLRAAKALGLSEDEVQAIETAIAYSPEHGDIIGGADGVRSAGLLSGEDARERAGAFAFSLCRFTRRRRSTS